PGPARPGGGPRPPAGSPRRSAGRADGGPPPRGPSRTAPPASPCAPPVPAGPVGHEEPGLRPRVPPVSSEHLTAGTRRERSAFRRPDASPVRQPDLSPTSGVERLAVRPPPR